LCKKAREASASAAAMASSSVQSRLCLADAAADREEVGPAHEERRRRRAVRSEQSIDGARVQNICEEE
jgi:hypothetical protein